VLFRLIAIKKGMVVVGVFLILIFITSCNKSKQGEVKLNVAISPYQDIAMLVNAEPLGLTHKYSIKLKCYTLAWEDILPAVASASDDIDIGFGSLVEYLTKYNKINPKGTKDPIVFVYPLYVYLGGAFISFNNNVPSLLGTNINDKELVKKFFSFRIGAQKFSIYEMLLFSLAKRNGVAINSLKLIDIPINEGFLAAQSKNLDISSAGLTQITETKKIDGRIVLTMEDAGFADITGFICKKSTLEKKRNAIVSLIKIWFEATAWVLSDLDKNAKNSLEYLRNNAATKYTLKQYKLALAQEFFPISIPQAKETIASVSGRYSYLKISEDVLDYLKVVKQEKDVPLPPKLIIIN